MKLTTLFLGLTLVAVPALAGGPILQYDAPDGSLAFTDSTRYVPGAAAHTLREKVLPPRARWTHVEAARAPHRWTTQPSYEAQQRAVHFGAAAESQRRQIEDAEALVSLADEMGWGQDTARLRLEQRVNQAERLEDACRVAGCDPGTLRRP